MGEVRAWRKEAEVWGVRGRGSGEKREEVEYYEIKLGRVREAVWVYAYIYSLKRNGIVLLLLLLLPPLPACYRALLRFRSPPTFSAACSSSTPCKGRSHEPGGLASMGGGRREGDRGDVGDSGSSGGSGGSGRFCCIMLLRLPLLARDGFLGGGGRDSTRASTLAWTMISSSTGPVLLLLSSSRRFARLGRMASGRTMSQAGASFIRSSSFGGVLAACHSRMWLATHGFWQQRSLEK